MADRPDSDREAQPPRQTPPDLPRAVRSDELLRGEKEVFILHHGETYRLRCTRQGKLILCK
jgi:hemin uptake protein HemP